MESDIELLTAREVSELLRVTIPTLQLWRLQKRGPAYSKVGRRVLYSKQDIEAFVETSKISSDCASDNKSTYKQPTRKVA